MTDTADLSDLGVLVLPVHTGETAREAVYNSECYLGASYLVTPEDGEGPVYAVAGEKDEAERVGALAAERLGHVAGEPYSAESSSREVWIVAVEPGPDPDPEPEDAPDDETPEPAPEDET